MVVGNEGKIPSLDNVDGQNLRSAGSSPSRQRQLQMQFDAWMNSLNIAKVPENVIKEMLEKGKGKSAADSYGATETTPCSTESSILTSSTQPMQQLGSSFPETQSSCTPFEAYKEAPKESSNPKSQSEVAVAPKHFDGQTYVPSQVNPGYGFSQQYPQLDYGYEMIHDYQLWQHAPIPWQQVESNASSGNFAQNYLSDFPQSPNRVTTNFVEANNYQGTPITQYETSKLTPANQNQLQSPCLPYMVFNNNGKSSKEGIHEDGNRDRKSNKKNNGSDVIDDEITSISPPPSVQVPPSSSGVSSDLNDIFPSQDPLGDDIPWTQKIQDTPIWEWDDLYFP